MMTLSQIRRFKRQHAAQGMTVRLTLTSLIDIFTLLVCFLLVGFQGSVQIPSIKGLALPISSSYIPPESALTLVVTPTEIRMNEKVIQHLDGSMRSDHTIDFSPLALALVQQARQLKATQVVNGSPERTVILLADQSIPYTTLHQIMAICSQQHFGRIAFAVNKEARSNV